MLFGGVGGVRFVGGRRELAFRDASADAALELREVAVHQPQHSLERVVLEEPITEDLLEPNDGGGGVLEDERWSIVGVEDGERLAAGVVYERVLAEVDLPALRLIGEAEAVIRPGDAECLLALVLEPAREGER